MMRTYGVNFAHVKHGSNWTLRKVAVRGWAPAAIKKALILERADRGRAYERGLRVESVTLIVEGD